MKVRTSSLLLTVRGLAKTVINYHHRSTTTFSYYPSRRPIPTRRISATRIPPTISATRISRRPYYNNDMTQDPSSSSSSSSIITPESLSRTLQERLEATHTAVKDMSGGCGQAFEAIIVSPQFNKKTTLARHRLVNGALKQEIASIHAWSPKCFSPDEWQATQAAAAADAAAAAPAAARQ